MNQMRFYTALCLALTAAMPATKNAVRAAEETSAAYPSADKILKDTSDVLAAAKLFSFKGVREAHVAVKEGDDLHEKSEIEVMVKRPSHAVAQASNSQGMRRMYFDGEEFTIFIENENINSTIAMEGSLDDVPVQLAERYGFVPPLADFATSDLYQDLKYRAQSISYAGTGWAGTPRVKCHRLSLSGSLASSELWIAIADKLPRKMTAKVTGGPGAGTDLVIEFTDWNLQLSASEESFKFIPPKDAYHTRMITVEEMEAAAVE